MGIPLRQAARVAAYMASNKLRGRTKYPLIVEMEPLFACNLECPGCGKIQYPTEILRKRLTVSECVGAMEECGAPMVSIAGGEPLLHPQIAEIVEALLERKRFVYLCTNGVLLRRKMDQFKPSPYFSWAVHVDGLRERHDIAVAPRGRLRRGRRGDQGGQGAGLPGHHQQHVLQHRHAGVRPRRARFPERRPRGRLGHGLAGIRLREGPDQEHFLQVEETRRLFRESFADGRRKKWRLNHSPLFLDFLEGKADFQCTPWGIPSYSVFGWQRPCYLMADGYTETYEELIESTDWDQYGRGRDERCSSCMAHCGYEPSAVIATAGSLRQSLRALVAG